MARTFYRSRSYHRRHCQMITWQWAPSSTVGFHRTMTQTWVLLGNDLSRLTYLRSHTLCLDFLIVWGLPLPTKEVSTRHSASRCGLIVTPYGITTHISYLIMHFTCQILVFLQPTLISMNQYLMKRKSCACYLNLWLGS